MLLGDESSSVAPQHSPNDKTKRKSLSMIIDDDNFMSKNSNEKEDNDDDDDEEEEEEEVEIKSVPGRRSIDIGTSLTRPNGSGAYLCKNIDGQQQQQQQQPVCGNSEYVNAVLFSEFDTHAGPIIVHQYPKNYITQAEWDAIYDYVITKPAFADKVVCVSEKGHRVVSVPKCLNDPKYFRNAYAFTVSFVLDDYASHIHDTLILEPVLKEITSKLADLERTASFLKGEGRTTLGDVLPEIYHAINNAHKLGSHEPITVPIPGTDTNFTLTLSAYTLSVPSTKSASTATTTAATTISSSVATGGLLPSSLSGSAALTAKQHYPTLEADDEHLLGTLLQRKPGHKRVQQLSPEAARFFECIVGTLPLVTIAHAAGFERNTQLIRHCAKELCESGYAFVPGHVGLLYVVTPKAREFIIDTRENRSLQDKAILFCAKMGSVNGASREELLRSIKRMFSNITTRSYPKCEKFDSNDFLLFALAHEWIVPMQEGNPSVNSIYVSEIPASGNPEHSVFLDPDGSLRQWV